MGVGENNSPRLAFRNICSPVASQEKSQSAEAFTHGRDFQDIDTLSHSYSESEFLISDVLAMPEVLSRSYHFIVLRSQVKTLFP